MTRTTEQFSKALNEVAEHVQRHKKPVWLVAVQDGYKVSVVRPNAKDIAPGTVAICYDENLESVDQVSASAD